MIVKTTELDNQPTINNSAPGHSRRRFLRGAVGSAAVLSAAGLPFASAESTLAQTQAGERQSRAEQAMRLRQQAAQSQRKLPMLAQPNNGDEDAYTNRIG
jgi:hypothetical protein